ncbi:hypothetical protein [Nocardia sp. CA-145437]|uniref:hypothetical protein n=1 Tax=Nocardia sp. CA-145437 TaxID=3239980 RepID=UPI003D978B0F
MSAPTVPEIKTYTLDLVCEITGAPSRDWLTRRIVRREIPAVRAGKVWRMTRSDMVAVVEYMRREAEDYIADKAGPAAPESPTTPEPNHAGLSARSAARLMRQRAATP